jgi:hypothetical protein
MNVGSILTHHPDHASFKAESPVPSANVRYWVFKRNHPTVENRPTVR